MKKNIYNINNIYKSISGVSRLKNIFCATVVPVILVTTLIIFESSAAVKKIRSLEHFEKAIDKKPFAIVLFYERDNHYSPESKKQITQFKQIFTNISNIGTYYDAGLQFLRINVLKDDRDMIAQQYGVATFPSMMLFKHNPENDHMSPLVITVKNKKNKSYKPLLLEGFTKPDAIKYFIDTYLGKDLTKYLESREKAHFYSSQNLIEQNRDEYMIAGDERRASYAHRYNKRDYDDMYDSGHDNFIEEQDIQRRDNDVLRTRPRLTRDRSNRYRGTYNFRR